MSQSTLTDQVVVVTGAASGIGLACAQQFLRSGAFVVLLDRETGKLEPALHHLGRDAKAQPVTCDVSDSVTVSACFQAIEKRHGRIDVLVNCAGINLPQRHFSRMSVLDWDTIVAVNLSGMFYCCHAAIEGMRRRGAGTLINFSSWAGRHAGFFTGPAYNASKRAVLALTESINIEEGLNGLRATSIVPEEVSTPLANMRPVPPTPGERARMLIPEDVARAVTFVAELPPRVCINELVISPTWNRAYLGLHRTALTEREQAGECKI